jgi:hypothetical protein
MLKPQGETGFVYRLAGKPEELCCLFAQREFPDKIDHYAPSSRFRNFPIHLPTFDKSQICVQLGLKYQQMLSFVVIPAEVIADRKKHVTGLIFDVYEINFVSLVNRHLSSLKAAKSVPL